MFVDHATALFHPQPDLSNFLLRGLGRLAFPIFAWFLAEGCRRTHDLPGYLKRLFLFALAAQLPFSLAFGRAGGSVILTLFLAGSAVSLYESAREHVPAPVALLPTVIPALIAHWTDSDYSYWGVLLVLALYLCGDNKAAKLFCAAAVLFALYRNIYAVFACLSLLLLSRYSGERGSGSKWFFYIFYPAHLLVLFFIRLSIP